MSKKHKKKRRIRKGRLFIVIIGFLFIILLILTLCYFVIKLIAPNFMIQEQVDAIFQPKKIGTVVLDAGHGGYDEGSSSIEGYCEKDITLSITLKTGKLLENKNVKVVYTRKDDRALGNRQGTDLHGRVNISNAADADYFLSIHTNSSENFNDGAHGSEVWTMFINNANIAFANNINDELVKIKRNESRGVKDEANHPLTILMYNQVPAALVEVGFISDEEEKNYLMSKSGQNELADALSKGILKTLKQDKEKKD
ncbi:MAG: N-acetylmuramoyl-L-alanine amidase [Erysipelotrichaceae bacterium]